MSELEKEMNQQEGMETVAEKEDGKIVGFFKKAFQDMKESAKAQHEVSKANMEAVKAESKAQWEEAQARIDAVKGN